MIFVPSLDPKKDDSFNKLLVGLVNNITHMANIIPRLYEPSGESYFEVITQNEDINEMKVEILSSVERVVQEAAQFCRDFERYNGIPFNFYRPC